MVISHPSKTYGQPKSTIKKIQSYRNIQVCRVCFIYVGTHAILIIVGHIIMIIIIRRRRVRIIIL